MEENKGNMFAVERESLAEYTNFSNSLSDLEENYVDFNG